VLQHILLQQQAFEILVIAVQAVFTALIALQAFKFVGSSSTRWAGPGRPLLFPCRTTHSRLFPKKHSFSYSYLVVGIPVGWEGVAGGLVSACSKGQKNERLAWWSLLSNPSKAWYHVDAADYLERGNSYLGLRGKLDSFLKAQVRISYTKSSLVLIMF
jgi:hypothetical protein